MSHQRRLTEEKIRTRLDLIRRARHRRRRVMSPFRLHVLPAADTQPPLGARNGSLIPWESHWATADTHFLLQTEVEIPHWSAPALYLPLGEAGDIFTHPEALAFVNGVPFASADRYHHTLPLDPSLSGTTIELALHGWTGWTGWPPDPDDRREVFMGLCAIVDVNEELDAFLTRAEVAWDVARYLDVHRPEKHAILNALDAAFHAVDTRDTRAMAETIARAHDVLDAKLAGSHAMDLTLHGIGHAHMDIAYLWPISQIRQKNARTYSNVLRLMERHSDYCFSHSQPQLYQWTKEDFPEIFARIKARVAEGRWEPMGGMWVEPDLNMPNGESLVRQIQLGRSWFATEFGPDAETPVLWLPDTFGFPAQIPQLMALSGLTAFLTNKVNWNQFNQMPSSTTRWEGLDGSRVVAQFLTTPRDVQYLPFPTNYKSDLSAEEVIGTWERNTAKEAVTALPICYGYGDGGGGPTETLIGKAKAFAAMPGAPRLKMSTVRAFFEDIADAKLPTWVGEIYLEGHRGVLTSQAWIKRANRQGEILLHEAEALGAIAHLATGHRPPDLTRAWELLCLNQFHDVVTGTSVSQVFVDAHRQHEHIRDAGEAAVSAAMLALHEVAEPGACALVANTRPFGGPTHAIVRDELDAPMLLPEGTPLAAQPVKWGTLLALPNVPAYSVASVGDGATEGVNVDPVRATLGEAGAVLENALIRIEIAQNGQLKRIYDKDADRDVLSEPGNQLQAFEDRPISWDAWDIDPFFEDRLEVIDRPATLDLIEQGPLRAVLEVAHDWRASKIKQKITLWHDSKRIDFATYVVWAERHILLKVAFPVAIRCSRATYEVQFGQVDRPTHRNTSWDWARFEVPAQKWADLSEAGYGVALLNDCKYGYDIAGNVIRLSLIKSSTMPDSGADQGGHRFTYSLLPHTGDWRNGVREAAYALNMPIRCDPVERGQGKTLEGFGTDARNIVIETAVIDSGALILRLFEAHGARGTVTISLPERVTFAAKVDLLGKELEPVALADGHAELWVRPHEIVTLRCTLSTPADV